MASSHRLKVAIVGCGRIGAMTPDHVRRTLPTGWLPLSVAEAVASMPDLDLAGLCDTNVENLDRACATFGVSARFTDHRELVEAVRPDIVAVATRTPGRADIIMDAVARGVGALHVEKPLGRSMVECNRALDAVTRHGIPLTYGALRRYMDAYRMARQLVASGEIGSLVEVAIEHGRSPLLWSHPHSVDLLQYFADDTAPVEIQGNCIIRNQSESEVDDDPIIESGFVRFANGVTGLITSGNGLNLRLSCTKGTLAVIADGSWLELRRLAKPDDAYFWQADRLNVEPAVSGRQQALGELAEALRGRAGTPTHTPETIARGQLILFALAYSSMHGGRRVRPEDLPQSFTVTGRVGSLQA